MLSGNVQVLDTAPRALCSRNGDMGTVVHPGSPFFEHSSVTAPCSAPWQLRALWSARPTMTTAGTDLSSQYLVFVTSQHSNRQHDHSTTDRPGQQWLKHAKTTCILGVLSIFTEKISQNYIKMIIENRPYYTWPFRRRLRILIWKLHHRLDGLPRRTPSSRPCEIYPYQGRQKRHVSMGKIWGKHAENMGKIWGKWWETQIWWSFLPWAFMGIWMESLNCS